MLFTPKGIAATQIGGRIRRLERLVYAAIAIGIAGSITAALALWTQ